MGSTNRPISGEFGVILGTDGVFSGIELQLSEMSPCSAGKAGAARSPSHLFYIKSINKFFSYYSQ